jgi:uroporphyrinogen III methyltransferase/synthase
LVTLRGKAVLEAADVVLYDNLASPELLRYTPARCEHVYVGKKRAAHALSQAEIEALLVARAQRGEIVVRLKGGDPFIFGRGGEEVEALAAAGVPFEVVPGVTVPLGVAAYTGVPLTHREHTSVVTFVTGHDPALIDWNRFGTSETLVLFMGLQHLPEIVQRLLASGRSPETPAMAVRWATRPNQQTIAGPLAALPKMAVDADLHPPVTVVVGEVVSLRERLAWFEKLPLFGKQVIITRAADQADSLLASLRESGADPVHIPVIGIAPPADYSALDHAIACLDTFDWIVLTSANAVDYFFGRLRHHGKDARAVRGRACAIGSATSACLSTHGITADLVPDEATGEGVVGAFEGSGPLSGKRILIPRATAARDVIPDGLGAAGATVTVADAYRNVIPADAEQRLQQFEARGRRPDWITFTSGSTVKNWLALAGSASLEGVKIASIGPATSEVARKHGLSITVEARPHTAEALVDAIKNFEAEARNARQVG